MDIVPVPISSRDLYARLGVAAAPFLLDVRRADAFNADERVIVGASRRAPDSMAEWLHNLPAGRPIVAYCVHGQEVSQNVARALRAAGRDATYLEGGMAHWKDAQLPTRQKPRQDDGKWVTREHPKIDRIACPWLISRFVNPLAEFIYVPVGEVPAVAKSTGAIPYDTNDADSGMSVIAARSTRSSGFTTFMMRRWMSWQLLFAARTRLAPI
jgi:rhodanese-related sulfurtransferase